MKWLVLMLAICSGCSVTNVTINVEWTDGPRLPMSLGSHAAFVDHNQIIVAGGTNWTNGTKIWNDQVWSLQDSWKSIAKLPVGVAPNAAGNILAGGFTKDGATRDALVFCNSRVEKLQSLPEPRALASGADAFIIGGTPDPTNLTISTASVLRLTEDGWQQVAPLPSPCAMMAACAIGDAVYVFGGMFVNDSAQAIRYDRRKDAWTKLADLPGARRGAVAVAIDDRFILVIGGCRNEPTGPLMLDEVLAYDTKLNRYQACGRLPYAAACQAAVMKDRQIYVTGGEDKPKSRTDRVVIGKVTRAVQ